MTVNPLAAPRVAVIVSDRTYRSLSNDEQRARILQDPDSIVIPYSAEPVVQAERVSKVRDSLAARDLLAPGQLLVRNPYDMSAYEFADDAIEAFVKAKYYHLASIAAHLGAASIEFVKVEVEHEAAAHTGRGRAKIKAVGFDARLARSVKSRIEGRFEATTDLGGKAVDVEAARAFAIERRLSNDPDVMGLIDLSTTGNPLRAHRVSINGLRESTRTLKAGLDLTVQLEMEVGGGAAFKRAVQSISSIEITTEIVWPSS